MKNPLGISAAILGFLALAGASQAQSITWGSGQLMTGVSDISTLGSYVDAAFFVGGVEPYQTATTLDGVTFNPITSKSDGFDISVAAGGPVGPSSEANTAPYFELLSGVEYTPQNSISTVTLSNLVAGDTYLVQVWAYTAPNNDGVTLTGTTNVSLMDGLAGQFSIGTFTATGATETFGFEGTGGYGCISGVLLENTIPEPATFGMVACGVGMLLMRQRVCSRRRIQAH